MSITTYNAERVRLYTAIRTQTRTVYYPYGQLDSMGHNRLYDSLSRPFSSPFTLIVGESHLGETYNSPQILPYKTTNKEEDIYLDEYVPIPGYESIWNSEETEYQALIVKNVDTEGSNYIQRVPRYFSLRSGDSNLSIFEQTFNIENFLDFTDSELLTYYGKDPDPNGYIYYGTFNSDRRFQISETLSDVLIAGYHVISTYWTVYWGGIVVDRAKVTITDNTDDKYIDKPCYLDLVNGYKLDKRKIPQSISIKSASDKIIKIGCYIKNNYEQINNLTTIDYLETKVNLKKDIEQVVAVDGLVLGTLVINDNSVDVNTLTNSTGYYSLDHISYKPNIIADLFGYWLTLYDTEVTKQQNQPPLDLNQKILIKEVTSTSENGQLKLSTAHYNYWNNGLISQDIGFDIDHPLFKIDDLRTFDYHFKLQQDGSNGNLAMDSIRTIRILEFIELIVDALEANKYAVDPNDSSIPRVANLGHLIENIASLLGYRPEPDGTFDPVKEKSRTRQIIPAKSQIDTTKIGVNNFGKDGMVLKRLNNRFNGDKIVADECVIVKDLLQLISEYHDQVNLALGIQESSAIEINNQNGTAKFNNQLELLIELVNLVKDSNEMIRSTLVSGLVTQGQTTELIAGLGLPSVTKTLPITIDGKNKQIPYKGIAAHRSISQEVATVAYNVGIVTGQLI